MERAAPRKTLQTLQTLQTLPGEAEVDVVTSGAEIDLVSARRKLRVLGAGRLRRRPPASPSPLSFLPCPLAADGPNRDDGFAGGAAA